MGWASAVQTWRKEIKKQVDNNPNNDSWGQKLVKKMRVKTNLL